jgi:hypothetical protein
MISKLLCLVLLTLLLSGCTEKLDTKKIQFETLDRGESLTVGPEDIKSLEKPTIFVANNAEETGTFIRFLKSTVVEQIRNVDFNKMTIIMVIRGKVESSGYGIAIQEINQNSELNIKVKLTEPDPERAVSPTIMYPYHIVLTPKKLNTGINLTVYTQNGTILTKI